VAKPEGNVLRPVVSDKIDGQGSHENPHEETLLEALLASAIMPWV
jgi:hypothetical protein